MQITSYGSFLNWTQRYTTLPGSTMRDDTDIILVGNGIWLFKSNDKKIQPDEQTVSYLLFLQYYINNQMEKHR